MRWNYAIKKTVAALVLMSNEFAATWERAYV